MKFIRDIIADKRERAHPNEEQYSEPRPDHDVMASILAETAPSAEPLHLDGEYMVPKDHVERPQAQDELPQRHYQQQMDSLPPEDEAQVQVQQSELDSFERDSIQAAVLNEIENELPPEPVRQRPAASILDDRPAPETRGQTPEDALENMPRTLAAGRISETDFADQDEDTTARPYKLFTRTRNLTRDVEPEACEDQAADMFMADEEEAQQFVEPDYEPPQPSPVPQEKAIVRPASLGRRPEMEVPQAAPDVAARHSGNAAAAARPIDVPSPAMGRGSSKAGRVKTRLLGFSPEQAGGADPFSRADASNSGYSQYPVGWLAIVKGPGRGAAFTLFSGVTVIGRGEGQTVRLDFGDNSISRTSHASIAYDPEQKEFFIGHGGKANLVRRNNRPVLSTEELSGGDLIRIGETTLRFVPLCGPDFGWTEPQQSEAGHGS